MSRFVQRTAIVGAIIASILGYLYHTPECEDMEQTSRIRMLSALMKISHFLSRTAEIFGISNRAVVSRKIMQLQNLLKDKKEDEGVTIENILIENIPVRIVRPLNSKETLPAIVYFHGGAFYTASVDTHNGVTSTLARSANVIVISVDYRLAPENPFPAGLTDCYIVSKYVFEHGHSKLGIDRSRVALAGDSAGGNIATVIAMRFATNPVGKYPPRLQLLIYPVLQVFDLMLPSYMEDHYQFFIYTIDNTLTSYLNKSIDSSIYANKHVSVEQKKRFRKYVDWSLIPAKYKTVYKAPITDNIEGDPQLIENAKLALTPEISPLLVEDELLAKLPATYLLSVGHDFLRDESFIYEGRLKRAGVSVVHNHYKHTFHGSLCVLYGPLGLDIAHQMMSDMVKYIKENL